MKKSAARAPGRRMKVRRNRLLEDPDRELFHFIRLCISEYKYMSVKSKEIK